MPPTKVRFQQREKRMKQLELALRFPKATTVVSSMHLLTEKYRD